MKYKIAVVDDEATIRQSIKDYLTALGYDIYDCGDGIEGLKIIKQNKLDLIILDIMMPGIDGIDILKKIKTDFDIPVIFITAKRDEESMLTGLNTGADDYIKKPFSLKELSARINAVLRRSKSKLSSPESDSKICFGNIKINRDKRKVYKNNNEVYLTPVQFEILYRLMRAPGRVFTREELLESFISSSYEGYSRNIDVHINNLRKALEDEQSNPVYIQTVWGVGYKFGD